MDKNSFPLFFFFFGCTIIHLIRFSIQSGEKRENALAQISIDDIPRNKQTSKNNDNYKKHKSSVEWLCPVSYKNVHKCCKSTL